MHPLHNKGERSRIQDAAQSPKQNERALRGRVPEDIGDAYHLLLEEGGRD